MAKRVVILGAGYAGLVAAIELEKEVTKQDAEIILVNKYDYHQLITQIHEPAAGTKSDQAVTIPLQSIIGGKAIRLVQDAVVSIDPANKKVELQEQTLTYDYLVVALGSATEYFGIPGLKEHSFTLKSVDEALTIHDHIAKCFAAYHDSGDKQAYITIIVGGAGFTGIELVGELADALPKLCEENNIPFDRVTLYNVEAAPNILPGFDPALVKKAQLVLEAKGVTFLTGTPIVQVEEDRVHLKSGEVIEAKTLIWTGGVRGNQIVIDGGFETEPRGRAKVNEYLQAVGYDDVYIIGDSCYFLNEEGRPYPPTAQISVQMGKCAAENIFAQIKGMRKQEFHPVILGAVASLGGKDAVGKIGTRYKATGRLAYFVKDMSNARYLVKIGKLSKMLP